MIHTRWSRHQGGPRVQFELSAEWAKFGCECTKYSFEDAFPAGVQGTRERFADLAAEYVRANHKRFDIIDCHQTDLPFTKTELGFDGLLVARSVGLVPIYGAILAAQDRRDLFSVWGPRMLARTVRTLPGYVARRHQRRWRTTDVEPSIRAADLVNVCNADEEQFVGERYGLAAKTVRLPFGLADDTRAAYTVATQPAVVRHAAGEVVFVGNWEPRKGSRDWWKIVNRVRQRVPAARFRFLGTGVDREYIRRKLGQPDGNWLTVIPRYDNAQLPGLIGGSTIGAFPSYVEGFPFGLLEMLYAGLPTIAYDAPGARDMTPPAVLTPVGDTLAMADALADQLIAPLDKYTAAAAAARAGVEHLRWPAIARNTLAIYQSKLADVRTAR